MNGDLFKYALYIILSKIQSPALLYQVIYYVLWSKTKLFLNPNCFWTPIFKIIFLTPKFCITEFFFCTNFLLPWHIFPVIFYQLFFGPPNFWTKNISQPKILDQLFCTFCALKLFWMNIFWTQNFRSKIWFNPKCFCINFFTPLFGQYSKFCYFSF